MRKEKTIDFHIKWAWHAISRLYNNRASDAGLTMAMGYVLLNVDSEKGTPATRIGPMLGMEPRSLTRMLKTLEEKGWIRRQSDKKDKRFVHIMLTEEGREKREFSRQGVIRLNKSIQSKIEPDKMATFFEVMQTINNLIDEENQRMKREDNVEVVDLIF